jgi:hypothetical protein
MLSDAARICAISFVLGALSSVAARAQMPETIAAPGEIKILEVHAEGAQIYECKSDQSGTLVWQFREPIASLMLDGKTAGRHYSGPSWELEDGSAVVGKVVARAAGATPKDIPWLKLEVISTRGNGQLSSATTIQRINTSGGAAEGACDRQGSLLSVPYASDYLFLKRGS